MFDVAGSEKRLPWPRQAEHQVEEGGCQETEQRCRRIFPVWLVALRTVASSRASCPAS